jgi:predicted transposase YdaD
MVFEEMLKEERAEGKAEGKAESVLELLESKGNVSTELQNLIMKTTDMELLRKMHLSAAKVKTVEEFKTWINKQ